MAYCPYCGEKVEKINAEPADEDAADEYAEDAAGETVEEAGETAEEPTEEKAEYETEMVSARSAGLCAGDQILKSLTEKKQDEKEERKLAGPVVLRR